MLTNRLVDSDCHTSTRQWFNTIIFCKGGANLELQSCNEPDNPESDA